MATGHAHQNRCGGVTVSHPLRIYVRNSGHRPNRAVNSVHRPNRAVPHSLVMTGRHFVVDFCTFPVVMVIAKFDPGHNVSLRSGAAPVDQSTGVGLVQNQIRPVCAG